jgi:hypothetical protein
MSLNENHRVNNAEIMEGSQPAETRAHPLAGTAQTEASRVGGAAPRAWVDIKLRELLKAAGSGRSGPIRVQAVYIAPPEDHRKERFRSLQARVIRQGTEFKPDAELEAFITELKGVGAV